MLIARGGEPGKRRHPVNVVVNMTCNSLKIMHLRCIWVKQGDDYCKCQPSEPLIWLLHSNLTANSGHLLPEGDGLQDLASPYELHELLTAQP